MSNKSAGGGPGKGCLQKRGEKKSMRQKRKEVGVRKTERIGRKNKCGLWKGMVRGAVNTSDTEGPYKEEGREKPNHICP